MKTSRYANSRQKTCQNCATSKLKCDRSSPACTRCRELRVSCYYPGRSTSLNQRRAVRAQQKDQSRIPDLGDDPILTTEQKQPATTVKFHPLVDLQLDGQDGVVGQDANNTLEPVPLQHGSIPRTTPGSSENRDALNFDELKLVCAIDATDIRNRWLNAFIPDPEHPAKQYPANVASFIFRMLKAYASTAVHGRGVPPFVHEAQLMTAETNGPLYTCLSLIRMCDTLLQSTHAVPAQVLQQQIEVISHNYGSYTNLTLLGAYQACLIYSMVLHFWLRSESRGFLRQAVMDLQELACATSREGLVCAEEQQGLRPPWEAWIVVEAKRRTLYTMYLFDNVLSAQDGLPTILGTELRGLPAPASKTL